jgi:hypothetical protein
MFSDNTQVPYQTRFDELGATAGLSGSAKNTVGQANRGTPQTSIAGTLGGAIQETLPARARRFFADVGGWFDAAPASENALAPPSFWAKWGYYAFSLIIIYAMLNSLRRTGPLHWAFEMYLDILPAVMLIWMFIRPKLAGSVLDRLPLPAILIVALGMRLFWVFFSGVTQTSDFLEYEEMTATIAQGGAWLDPSKSTGASILYAPLYVIFGRNPLWPQILQAFLSTLQILLAYFIARRTSGGERAGKIAALALTLWPEHLFYVNIICSDVPFSTLVLAAVWLLWSDRRGYWLRVFAAGIILGMAAWVRPNAMITLTAFVAFLLLRNPGKAGTRESLAPAKPVPRPGPKSVPLMSRISKNLRKGNWPRRAGFGAAAAVGFFLLTLPILCINYRDRGELSVTIAKRTGFNLMFGANVKHQGKYNDEDLRLLEAECAKRERPPKLDKVTFQNNVALEIANRRFREHPLEILAMAVRYKISEIWAGPGDLYWCFATSRYYESFYSAGNYAAYYHLVAITLAAAVVFRHRSLFSVMDERWIYAAFALLTTASHLLVEVRPRFHHAFLPFFAICIGAYALSLGQSVGSETDDRHTPKIGKAS